MAIVVPTDGAIISAGVFGKPVADEINRITPLVNGAIPTAWTALSLANGWTNIGGGLAPMQYRKVGDVVQLRGVIVPGSWEIPFAQMPVGFRPPWGLIGQAIASTIITCQLGINTDSNLIAYKPAGSPNQAWLAILTQYSVTA